MGLLQYTSNEMFSSTELVRKNKNIFDKLNKNEIEKAIVLRDGKPAVILLDFTVYEELMKDYIRLKDKNEKSNNVIKKVMNNDFIEENIKVNNTEKQLPKDNDLNFSFDSDLSVNKPEPLKEFWD